MEETEKKNNKFSTKYQKKKKVTPNKSHCTHPRCVLYQNFMDFIQFNK